MTPPKIWYAQKLAALRNDGSDPETLAKELTIRRMCYEIEKLEEEKRAIADDIKDVYNEAKATGYDAKIMRQIVRLRKMEAHDRQEMEAILDTYKAALGLA